MISRKIIKEGATKGSGAVGGHTHPPTFRTQELTFTARVILIGGILVVHLKFRFPECPILLWS